MEMIPTGDRLHVFFDTTEVAAREGSGQIGRIGGERLRAAAAAIGAVLYIPDLVIDEVAYRRLRHLKKKLETLRAAEQAVKDYVAVSVGAMKDDDEMVGIFRQKIQEALTEIPITVIPSASVTLQEVLALSKKRVPPFKPEDDPRGFQDAVILLTVLKYAQANGIHECTFVSNDGDHEELAVNRLASDHGVVCRLVRNTDIIVEMMEKLRDAHFTSLHDAFVKQATEFMNVHKDEVQRYLVEHPLKVGDFARDVFGILQMGWLVEIRSITVDAIQAIPESIPREGEDCHVSIFAKAVGVFLFEEHNVPPPRVVGMEASPGSYFADRPRKTYVPGEVLAPGELPGQSLFSTTIVVRELEVPLAGEALLKFAGGHFVGRPAIQSLEVYRSPFSTI